MNAKAESFLQQAGAISGYRGRVYSMVSEIIRALGPISTAVDVGAGDGWYASRLVEDGAVGACTAVETVRRKEVFVEPVLYDGLRIPMKDGSAELIYAVDTLHHAENPYALLDEMVRVGAKWLVLKDHTYTSSLGFMALAVLDELGNRRFGIHSPGRYQRDWKWIEHLSSRGFQIKKLIHPAPCHRGILGNITNRLQWAAAFERSSPGSSPGGT